MRKFVAPFALLICLFAAQSAAAAIPNVFGTLTCTTQASGQRFCGPALGSTTPSFDGAPIDVSVAFPVATGADNNYPVIGLYHGYGNPKILPSSATAQRWLNQGYAVFAIQDRGFFASCGVLVPNPKPAMCTTKGYIHLLHNAYEVHDAQYLLGKLAD